MKNHLESAAIHYENLSEAEQADYFWEADLAQCRGEWAALANELLPADSLYLQDLNRILLSAECEEL